MDTIRRFFANFQKHGTVSRISNEKIDRSENSDTEAKPTFNTQANEDVKTHKKETDKVLTEEDKGATKNLKINEVIEFSDSPETIESFGNPAIDTTTKILGEVNKNLTESLKQHDEIVPIRDLQEMLKSTKVTPKSINTENLATDDTTECLKHHNEVIEIPDSQGSSKNTDTEKVATDDTTECLKEFDEILDGFSKNITEAYTSLDEIEDVIKNINDDSKEYLLQIPRFDLQDLIQSFGSGSVDENLEAVEIINLDEDDAIDSTQEPIDLCEIDELNEFVEAINTGNLEYFVEIDTNVQDAEVISISSEDSQSHTYDFDENMGWNDEPKDKEKKYEPENVVIENNVINDEPENVVDENKGTNDESKINDNNMILTDKPKSVTQNYKLNNLHEENEVVATTESINDKNELDNMDKKEAQKHENDELDLKSEDRSIDSDDCGYQSSDFEFITEDEAIMDGLIINFNPESLKHQVSKPKKLKTIDITIDPFALPQDISNPKRKGCRISNNLPSAQNVHNSPELNSFSPGQSNLRSDFDKFGQRDVYKLNHGPIQVTNETNGKSSLRNIRIRRDTLDVTKSPVTIANEDNLGVQISCIKNDILEIKYSGPSNIKRNDLDMYNFECVPSFQDCPLMHTFKSSTDQSEISSTHSPGLNDFGDGPSNLQTKNPNNTCHSPGKENIDINNFGPGPSKKENNFGYGSSNFGNSVSQQGSSNCIEMPDPSYERWRAFRNRNRFALNKYKENHRMLYGDDYYRLFDPNCGPQPNQGTRLMENKSTLSMSMMLVEYDGIGFNMQMMKDWSDNEENEVKEEANESARKILDMYPAENRKRRRRF